VLTPLNQRDWTIVRESIKENPAPTTSDIDVPPAMEIENDVYFDEAQVTTPDSGIILDAGREVRAKLYLGQVYKTTPVCTTFDHYSYLGLHGLGMVYPCVPHVATTTRHFR